MNCVAGLGDPFAKAYGSFIDTPTKKAAPTGTALSFIPFNNLVLEHRQVSDEEPVAVVVDLIVAFQFVEYRAHRLTGRGGQISNVLMGQERVEQRLKSNFAALAMRGVLQELDDAGTTVLKGQSLQAFFSRTQLLRNLSCDFKAQFRIGA